MPAASPKQLAKHAMNLFQHGNLKGAIEICEGLLKQNNRDLHALKMKGSILTSMESYKDALTTFKKALKIKPNDIGGICGLGKVYYKQGKYQEAIRQFDQALRMEANNQMALAGKAESLAKRGRTEVARDLLELQVKSGKASTELQLVYASLQQRLGLNAEAIEVIEKFLQDESLPINTRTVFWFIAARAYEQLGNYQQAFDGYTTANELCKRPFDYYKFATGLHTMAGLFSQENLSAMAQSSCESELPVFIVGMPLSGSTLVEQIIHAHPQAFGAGEVEIINMGLLEVPKIAGEQIQFPAGFLQLNQDHLDYIANKCLSQYKRIGKQAKRVVDKNLMAFQKLGMVWRLFPNARIIHCKRDPLEMCLSCFIAQLDTRNHPFSTEIEDIGNYHRSYEKIMDHWRDVVKIPMLEVQYEELVENQEEVSRRIINYLGLKWDDKCLRFFEAKRHIRTLSADQVIQPIFRTALGRTERFKDQLGPLKKVLAGM